MWTVTRVKAKFCANHFRPSLGRFIFVRSIPWTSYFRTDRSILHHLASYFLGDHLTVNPSISFERFVFVPSIPLASYLRADHVTLHPFIPLASYFCAAHPLEELFSFNFRACLLIFHPLASYFCADHVTVHQSTGFSLGRLHMGGGVFVPPHTGGTSAALMGKWDGLLKVLLLLSCNYTMRFIGYDSIKTCKTHILSLSNSHNSTVPMQKSRGDKWHRVIVALLILL